MYLDPWRTLTTTPLPKRLSAASAIVSANGYIYIMGGVTSAAAGGQLNNTVYSAKINTNGTLEPWVETTPLPQALSGTSAIISANGYIYIMGGQGIPKAGEQPIEATKNTVYSAKINANGTLEPWVETTSLPQALFAASAIVSADGYIYFMGGGNPSGTDNTTVYSAKINANGTLKPWVETTPLPQALYYTSAIVSADGYIYIMGGTSFDGQIIKFFSTVYSAKINANGTLKPWVETTPLPQALRYTSAIVSADGYIYIMGGQGIPKAGEEPIDAIKNTVYSAKINANGTLKPWVETTPLPQALYYTSAIVSADGYIYIMGGGDDNNTVYSAKINNSSPTPIPTSNICFPAGTPIQTDQGVIAIEKLDKTVHTLRGQPILHVTQTVTLDKYLIAFAPHSIGRHIPTARTIMTKDHQIEFDGRLAPAERFLQHSREIKKVKYTGEILYNVLLPTHSRMSVNGLVCETLHPENIIAKLYTQFPPAERNNIILLMNDALKQKDSNKYKNALARIGH